MTERSQRNRCSVEWTTVVEVGEESTGSISVLPSTFYGLFSAFLAMSIIFDEAHENR